MPEMSDALKALVMVGAFIGLIFISGGVWMLGGCLAELNHKRRARKRAQKAIDDGVFCAPEGGARRLRND